jgi:hypothetical protein
MQMAEWFQSWPKKLEKGVPCNDCPWDSRDRAVVKFTYREPARSEYWLCRGCCDARIARHKEYERSAA